MRDYLVRFWKRYLNRTDDYERMERLLEKGGITQEEYDEITGF